MRTPAMISVTTEPQRRKHFIYFFFTHCIYFSHHNHLTANTIPYIPPTTLKTPFKSQSKT